MSDFTRGYTFEPDEKLSPGKLNQLIENATVSNITAAELGPDFSRIFYTNADPGCTYARIWYDTLPGHEGLKYSFVSPSNASICGWLYATPRREGYYWAETSVSNGTPCFVGSTFTVENWVAYHKYDGTALLKIHPAVGSTTASEATPALVVTTESRSGAGPVRAAWAGLINANTHQSQVTFGNPIFIDHHVADRFTSLIPTPTTIKTSLKGRWKLEEASGVSRADSGGLNYHLREKNTPVGNTAGKINTYAAHFNNVATQAINRTATDADLRISSTDSCTLTCWVKLDGKVANRRIVNNYPGNYDLVYVVGTDSFAWTVFSNAAGTSYTSVFASTFGSPTVGTWYFLQARLDVSLNQISIRVNNGAWDTATHNGGGGNATTNGLHIGLLGTNAEPFWGAIDDVTFWKRALTTAELNTLYNGGTGKDIDTVTGSPELSRSSIYGTVLHNRDNTVGPSNPPGFVLWGTGPVIQDINQS